MEFLHKIESQACWHYAVGFTTVGACWSVSRDVWYVWQGKKPESKRGVTAEEASLHSVTCSKPPMIWNCTLSKWHFWGSSRISVGAKRHLIRSRFMEPFSARITHHGLRPPRAVAFSGGSRKLPRPAGLTRFAGISFTRGSWNLSRPAYPTTVCCYHAPSHLVEVHGTLLGV